MRSRILGTLGSILAMLALYNALAFALDTPIVQRSVDSGDCLRVLQPSGGSYSCQSLPSRYTTEWVER